MSYVLNNWRHHRADRGKAWLVDPFSSGFSYSGWCELAGRLTMWTAPPGYEPLCVFFARTWLLQHIHGTISAREVPG